MNKKNHEGHSPGQLHHQRGPSIPPPFLLACPCLDSCHNVICSPHPQTFGLNFGCSFFFLECSLGMVGGGGEGECVCVLTCESYGMGGCWRGVGRDRQLSISFLFVTLIHVLRCSTKVQFADLMRVRCVVSNGWAKAPRRHGGGGGKMLPACSFYHLRATLHDWHACYTRYSTQSFPTNIRATQGGGSGHGQLITKSRFAWKGVDILRRTSICRHRSFY
jgi:hypothetical protein